VGGFTLLELIVALLLMSTMMSAAWMMMATFRDRMETSQQRIERAQLVRSLQQTLERDLHANAIAIRRDEHDNVPSVKDPSAEDEESSQKNKIDSGISLVPAEPGRATKLDPALGDDGPIPADWLSPDTFLVGTPQSLVFDRLSPAEPALGPPPAVVQPELESAEIPDVTRRVVYAFVDPATAVRTGRPRGLIRCQVTNRQLTMLRNPPAGNLNFLDIVQPALAVVGSGISRFNAEPLPFSTVPATEPTMGTVHEPPPATDHFGQAAEPLFAADDVDYIPEVCSLLFRFYDGQAWQTSWDTRQLHDLPVAIELRFRLLGENDRAAARAEIIEGDFELPVPSSALEEVSQIEAIEPVDDRMHSAQTRPVNDHRFLILLRAAPRDELEPATNFAPVPERDTR
jgi:prepilin-type N-terminal cleavage/methylation domain-containing protein